MIDESLCQPPSQDRLIEQMQAALLQRPKRCHEISAIHRRNKERRQWLKRARVIPVVKMPAMTRHFAYGVQRLRRLLHKLSRRQIAEFACHLTRIQQKAHVGGRNARSN